MTSEFIQLIESNPLAAVLVVIMVLMFLLLWVVCAVAKLDEGCFTDRHCDNCRHQTALYYNENCADCMKHSPVFPNWEEIGE